MTTTEDLRATARQLVAPGQGILAADESDGTIRRRFDSIGVESTVDTRRAYREMLFTTPEAAPYIGGVILFEETLRAGLALVAHRAYLVTVPQPLESSAVADVLAAVFRAEKPDLVIAGKQSVDTDSNQAGQMLAARLGLPQACFAYRLAIEGGKAVVQREIDGGLETKEVGLPFVISADLRLNTPRYASLPAIMKAKKNLLALSRLEC